MSHTFKITAIDSDTEARTGQITTTHGIIETPAFAPVASQGTVKALLHSQVESLGTQVLLVNAYHLFLRPGLEIIEEAGGVEGQALRLPEKTFAADGSGAAPAAGRMLPEQTRRQA